MLPPDQVESYFQFAGLDPVRASTVRTAPPVAGMDCILAGFQKSRSLVTTVEKDNSIEVVLTPDTVVLVAHFREADELHYWLDGGTSIVNPATAEALDFRPGDLDGMSGCGFWSVERSANEVKFALHGVHTVTRDARLRETPITHHLRLLAEHSMTFRQKAATVWPSLLAGT